MAKKRKQTKYIPPQVLATDSRGYTMTVKDVNGVNIYNVGCRTNWTAKRCLDHWNPERYGWSQDRFSGIWRRPSVRATRIAELFTKAVNDYESGITPKVPPSEVEVTRKNVTLEDKDLSDVTFIGTDHIDLTNCTINVAELPDTLKSIELRGCTIIGELSIPEKTHLHWYP